MSDAHGHDRLLAGLRIIDAGQVVAGPFVGTLLADMGADVIRVELPALKDQSQALENSTRAGEQRNKKSVSLDLRVAEGAALFKRLVAEADAVVENFSPGTMERWGVGMDGLAEANPRLIFVRISGFGQTGPYRDRTSYDRIGQAMGGLIYVTGPADTPNSDDGLRRGPVHPGYMLADYASGTFGALAILPAPTRLADLDAFERVTDTIDEAVAKLDDVNPPASAGDYQRDVLRLYRGISSAQRDFIEAATDGDAARLNAATIEYQAELQRVFAEVDPESITTEIEEALRTAGCDS